MPGPTGRWFLFAALTQDSSIGRNGPRGREPEDDVAEVRGMAEFLRQGERGPARVLPEDPELDVALALGAFRAGHEELDRSRVVRPLASELRRARRLQDPEVD